MAAHLPFPGTMEAVAALAATSLLWWSSAACAAIIEVRPDGTGDAPTIQAGLDLAVPGDEVVLSPGLFRGPGNRGLVVDRKAVALRSATGDPADCVIDCGGVTYGIFVDRVATGVVLVQGLTVRAGGQVDIGSALGAWLSSIEVSRCVFANNQGLGAALVFDGCSVVLEQCVVADNLATLYPGGGVGFSGGVGFISRCTLVGNSAYPDERAGGVVCQDGASVDIEYSIISDAVFGAAALCDEMSSIRATCSNVHGNAGGDWTGCLAGQEDTAGNLSANPLFCDSEERIYTLKPGSPCGPDGPCGLIGALPVECAEPEPIAPSATRLGPPWPNPTTNGVKLNLDVTAGTVGSYRLHVVDLAGRRILERIIEAPAAASYAVGWDGRDGAGRATPAGVYFLRLEGPGFAGTRRVVRLQ